MSYFSVLQLVMEWKDILLTYYAALDKPADNIIATVKRGLLRLALQLRQRISRFKEGKVARDYLKSQDNNDRKYLAKYLLHVLSLCAVCTHGVYECSAFNASKGCTYCIYVLYILCLRAVYTMFTYCIYYVYVLCLRVLTSQGVILYL